MYACTQIAHGTNMHIVRGSGLMGGAAGTHRY